MKKCYKCNLNKDVAEFSKNKSRKDGLSSQCKNCHSNLRRKHYLKHKNKILKQVKEKKKQYWNWAKLLKDKPCADCNIKYPYYVMQFDHINPELKSFNVSQMLHRNVGKENVLEEIEKCDIVCANCHAERTHKRLKRD